MSTSPDKVKPIPRRTVLAVFGAAILPVLGGCKEEPPGLPKPPSGRALDVTQANTFVEFDVRVEADRKNPLSRYDVVLEVFKKDLQERVPETVAIDPLVLDLDGDGVETTTLSKTTIGGVNFNLDAKGLAEKTGWVGKDDGLLVRDLDGDGLITSGRELFGNHALLQSGKAAANGIWRQAA